jgi:nitrite reductase/ring-hydroxylating ferredoxin subunit
MIIGAAMAKVFLAKTSDVPEGKIKQIKVEGKDDIALANVSGNYYAMRGLCNHQEGPLGEGELVGNVVTCPWHGSKWDVITGKLVEFPLELDPEPTYPVTVEGDSIFAEL